MHAYIDNNCLTFRLVTTMNFSFNKNAVLKGTVILTLAGIISRIAGFFYRIFLTRQIGADGIGMFQLVTPVLGIAFALCSAGIQTAISRFCAAKKFQSTWLFAGLAVALPLSVLFTFFTYAYADFIAVRIFLNKDCSRFIRILAIAVPFCTFHNCVNGYYLGKKQAGLPAFSQLFECRSNGLSINLRACRAWGISPHSALRMPCSTWIKRMPKALRRRSSTRTSRSITAPCAAI